LLATEGLTRHSDERMPEILFNNQQAQLDRAPDVCPICHNGIEPTLIGPA